MLPARRRLSWSLLLITSWLAPANGLAQILKGQIDQLEGTKCRLMIRSSETKWDRAVSWRVVSGNRCLTLGESKLKKATHTDGDDPELHAFEFETPKVNPGVALNAELHFHVETSDEYPVLAIRVRATNPFASLQKIMQEAGVALYDPRRETAATLEGLQVKFLNVNSLKESKQQSIVVLGEGSDWESRHEIDIASLMKAGQWIIILRPREGSPFPLIRNEKEESELTFGKWSGSNWFPDRLDREFWSTTEEDSFGFELCSRPKQILLTASKGPQVGQYAT